MAAVASSIDESVEVTPEVEPIELEDVSFYDVAEHFSGYPYFALLDSRTGESGLAKYSFITFEPFAVVGCKGPAVWVRQDGTESASEENIFDTLDRMMRRYRIRAGEGAEPAPFLGGGIGYFAYELGRQIEKLPAAAVDEFAMPDCLVCFYNFVIILSHEDGGVFLSYFDPMTSRAPLSKEFLLAELMRVRRRSFRQPEHEPERFTVAQAGIPPRFQGDFTKSRYLDAINRAKEYIFAGDVYQVNLTQRFQTRLDDLTPWDLYKRLMEVNPAPFACYLDFGGVTVVSSSPERFVRVSGRIVETRPIKGTVRRGATPDEDAANKKWLLASAKNRAELAMIVDLLRNDIGRICEPGTVKVRGFPTLETYAGVHHLVASITGELRHDATLIDLIKAAFPGGSITGAPKIRAMEIIDELEPVTRGIYTGSIGYLGFNGEADLNIVIRTVIVKEGIAYIQVGGGIVADSVDIEEYDETLLKARKLFNAFPSRRCQATRGADRR